MNEKTYLTENQKQQVFKLINDGGTKKDVEQKYFALTKQTLKQNTYKKYRKDAKKYVDEKRIKTREYKLPAAQQAFEKKACDVLEAFAQCGDLRYSTIREILTWVQTSFDEPEVTKLKFSLRYISRFIKTHRFRSKRSSNQLSMTEDELGFERWRLNQALLKFKPQNIINCDETGLNHNKRSTSKAKLYEHENSDGRSKTDNCKATTTVMPYITAIRPLGFKPLVMTSRLKGTKWMNKSGKVKRRSVFIDNELYHVDYTEYDSFVLIPPQPHITGWMTKITFSTELARLDEHLKTKYPTEKFALLADNCPSHATTFKSPNIELIFFKPNVTGYLQPADLLYFG